MAEWKPVIKSVDMKEEMKAFAEKAREHLLRRMSTKN